MFKILLPNILATNISNFIISENPEFYKNRDNIRYGLEWMLSGMNQIIFVCLLAWPFGLLLETLVTLLTGALLRMFSGGAHFKRYFTCLIFSTVQIFLITFVCVNHINFLSSHSILLSFLLLFSFLINVTKAPVLHKKRHLFNTESLLKLKITAIFIFILCTGVSLFLPHSIMYCVWLALIFQGITLTTLWEKIILFSNDFINKITKKELNLL